MRLQRYVESVDGLPDGRGILGQAHDGCASTGLPLELQLELGGTTRYRVLGGVFRTLADAQRVLGDRSSPFASIALLNRYTSERAELTLSGLGEMASDAFASATDLGTGLERPEPIARAADSGEIRVSVAQCPPRTLLRIYFRLDRG